MVSQAGDEDDKVRWVEVMWGEVRCGQGTHLSWPFQAPLVDLCSGAAKESKEGERGRMWVSVRRGGLRR